MKDILKGRRLILGSKSPRRFQLLKEMDISFVQKVADIEETFPADMDVKNVAAHIAVSKADALLERLKEKDIILTADSIVVCNDKIYGKPKNKKEAHEYIREIENKIHFVITGICIRDEKNMLVASETSEVKLGEISNKELKYYVDTYMPIDKAGAYGIQEWFGHTKIEWIKGTYTNIMGLPTKLVYDTLKEFIKLK